MNRNNGQRGFTLLELLVALAVFSIVVAVLYSALFASERAVTDVEARLQGLREARMALDAIGREVESSLRSGSGGTIALRDRDVFGRQASGLSMETFSSPLPGAARVSYEVEEDDKGRLVLLKRLAPAWRESSPNNDAAPVIEEVEAFTVEAWDGNHWLKTWRVGDTAPDAIRITLTVNVGGERSITLTETVRT